jgi:pimeloyl-ACP methyl ester carboxylesterase
MPPTIVLVHGAFAESAVPSRFVIGEDDRNIPAALQHYMAKRAGAHRTLEIPGASHAITVSHPQAIAHQILDAAAVRVTA